MTRPRLDNTLQGLLYVLGAALLFSFMSALIKWVSADLPNTMVVFFRNAFGLLALAPWLLRNGWAGVRTRCPRLHLLRSAAGLTAMYCFFFAIAHLPLASAVLLNYTAPLFIPLIALLWLGEPFPAPVRWAVLIGFAGVALILKPDAGTLDPMALIGLCAGFFSAVAFVTIRRLSRSEPAGRTVFYFSFLATLVSAVPLVWSWQTPQPMTWLWLILIGVVATTAQILLTRGYGAAPAARVGPAAYTVVVFSAGLGWLVWNETLDGWSVLGAALVCLACILAVRLRDHGARPAPSEPPQESTGRDPASARAHLDPAR